MASTYQIKIKRNLKNDWSRFFLLSDKVGVRKGHIYTREISLLTSNYVVFLRIIHWTGIRSIIFSIKKIKVLRKESVSVECFIAKINILSNANCQLGWTVGLNSFLRKHLSLIKIFPHKIPLLNKN